MSDVGESLRLARLEAGMTLRDVESASGVNKDALSRIERGLVNPQPLTIAKLARAYGRTVEEFLYPKVAVGWVPESPRELLEQSGAASRWSVMPDAQWQATIESADADTAKRIHDELEEERKATFKQRQIARTIGTQEAKNAAARLGFRFLTRGSQAALRTRDQRVIEEAERIGAEALLEDLANL